MADYEKLVRLLRSFAESGGDERCDECPYAEDYPPCVSCINRMTINAADAIKELSSTNVELIRCKGCDNWNEWDSVGSERYGNYRCSCAYWSNEDGYTAYTAPTDFCSYAEPKEANDE